MNQLIFFCFTFRITYEIVRDILKVCELSIFVNNLFGKSVLNMTPYRI
jgi:hypothetical protein